MSLPSSFLLLCLLLFMSIPSISSVTLVAYKVNIFNDVGNAVTAHCKINDEDQGTQLISDTSPPLKLTVNINLGKNDVVTCDLSVKDIHGNFKLFDYQRDGVRCSSNRVLECNWQVRADGLYLNVGGNWTLQYSW